MWYGMAGSCACAPWHCACRHSALAFSLAAVPYRASVALQSQGRCRVELRSVTYRSSQETSCSVQLSVYAKTWE